MSKDLTSDSLNRRIQIQSPSPTQDSYGQPINSWTPIYRCWAEIDIQGSSLLFEPSRFVEKVLYRITMRWTSSVVIKPNMRIVYTEATTGVVHTYEIEALLNTKTRNRELVVMCYELDGVE